MLSNGEGALIRRGSKRKVSVDLAWRRYTADNMTTVGADVLTVGLGVGL